jgi:hypothetical protein
MNLDWSAADLAFRDEVRSFLDEKLTAELREAGRLITSVYSYHEASTSGAGRRRPGRSNTAGATGA